jgi:hypothetical protein
MQLLKHTVGELDRRHGGVVDALSSEVRRLRALVGEEVGAPLPVTRSGR